MICEVPPPPQFEQTIEAASEKFNIEKELLQIIANKESRCRQDVVGAAGEIGLMQINPSVWKDEPYNWNRLNAGTNLSWEEVYTVEGNIIMGAWILKNAINAMDGNLRNGIALYNGYSEAGLKYADDVLRIYETVKNK